MGATVIFARHIFILIITAVVYPVSIFIGLFLGNVIVGIDVWYTMGLMPHFMRKFGEFIIGSGIGGLLAGYVMVFISSKLVPSGFRWWVLLVIPVLLIAFNSLEIALRLLEEMQKTVLWWSYFGSISWLVALVYVLGSSGSLTEGKNNVEK